MLHKSISALVILILVSLVFGPLGAARAESSNLPVCPPYEPTLMRDKSFVQSRPLACAKTYQKLIQRQEIESNTSNVIPLAVGGPDAFGYTYDDAVPYNWIAASTNTGISGDDVISGAVNIGFNFPFYGINYSQLYFNTNGGITFGAGSYEYGGFGIPFGAAPNNLIAPFWEDLVVGSPHNSGAIFYTQGGTAPNRYFILEWRAVTTYSGSSPFSFEAILYENGDIVTQLQSLPTSYYSTIGIENNAGDDGLQYQRGTSGLSAPKAIRFYYPTTLTARVLISPLDIGLFSSVAGTKEFVLTVGNPGSMGIDTYDLTVVSPWPTTLYAADGVTPIVDTDTDGTVDTGPIPQGSTVTITVKVATPVGAMLGSANTANVTARSSLNISKSRTATLQSAIPAPFAQIYRDYTDGAMNLELIRPDVQLVKKAAADGQYGYDMAMTAAPNGNFIYAWNKGRCLDGPCNIYVKEIEYTLLDHSGNTMHAVSKLADHSSATVNTHDNSPSVAVTPNGTIGIVWYRWLYNSSTAQDNYNIYFATLDGAGNLLTGPTNITNNLSWNAFSDPNPLSFYSPTIAASDDNRFILSWQKRIGNFPYATDNIWYATRDSAGTSIFSPTELTISNRNFNPILNSLTGGKAILTWINDTVPTYRVPTYAILHSNGTVTKFDTPLGDSNVFDTPDAVQLTNGKVAVAWANSTGIQYEILNSSYGIESGPHSVSGPSLAYSLGLSVTTDSSSRVIMTWQEGSAIQKLFYALGDSTGAFITLPMIYKNSSSWFVTSYNGQGNAPVTIPNASVSSIVRASANPTSAASVDFTVTFSDNVTGVDVGDFNLTITGGVSGATVSGVSGTGSVYTVSINTGSGNGTIRLDVVDNDSILDTTLNPLGGTGLGNGNFTTGEVYLIGKNIPPVNFGDQLFHTSNPPTVVTIPNTHGTDIHIGTLLGSASVGTTWNTGQSFFIENDTCSGATVIPSGSCTFKVRFLPWSLGAKSGTITVLSDAPDQPYIVSLSGNSIAGTQLLSNRSFDSYSAVTNLPDLWTVSPGIKVGIDTMDSSWAFNGPLSFKFVGDGDLKILSQTINKAGVAGDDFSFNVMTKGVGIPVNAQRWLLQVMFLNNGVTVENRNIPLTTGTFSNVRLTRMYTAVSSYNQILFRIHYGKSSGTAWVDLANLQWAP